MTSLQQAADNVLSLLYMVPDGTFKNGVTDLNGAMDEGEYQAGAIVSDFRAALSREAERQEAVEELVKAWRGLTGGNIHAITDGEFGSCLGCSGTSSRTHLEPESREDHADDCPVVVGVEALAHYDALTKGEQADD